jgi:hypothetical protein
MVRRRCENGTWSVPHGIARPSLQLYCTLAMKLSVGAILKSSNTKRHSSTNLIRGHRGRKARTAVTEAEISFCAYFVLTGNVKQASLQAGYSAWWGYELLKMPRIQPVLREFEDQKKEEAWSTAKNLVLVTREFLDEQFMYRLVNMRTHHRSGDMAIVKMFEVGYKRTGDIQPAKVTNNQTGVVVKFVGKPAADRVGDFAIDQSGHIYGVTMSCGDTAGCIGVVFKITP